VEHIRSVKLDDIGCPLPPHYYPSDPQNYLPDIADITSWQAYDGQANVGALQAFYLRELPYLGWQIEEYVPYPAQTNLGFARLKIRKGKLKLTLGILPIGEQIQTGKLVIKS
jgi:hypothetical protein